MHSYFYLLLAYLFITPSLATALDLEDLNVPTDRIPTWYPFDEALYTAAQSWPEYDVTCSSGPCGSGKNPYTDLTGVSGCSDVTTTDFGGMDCIIDGASENDIVLFLPAGTYEIDDGEGMSVQRSRIVIRGEGIANTILERNEAGNEAGCDDTNGTVLWACSSTGMGTSTGWTAGYALGTTVVTVTSTVGFSVGGWVSLDMDYTTACEWLDETPGRTPFSHLAIVTDISGSDITIDRGLRFQYDGTGCTGFDATPWTPEVEIGVEDLRITSDTGVPVCSDSGTCIRHKFLEFHHVANSWIVNVQMDRNWERWFEFQYAARSWIQGSDFDDLDESISYNTEGMLCRDGCVDNVWENNTCSNSSMCTEFRYGAEGTILGYNYFDQDQTTGACEKAFFNHGFYPRENLLEGNDVNCAIILADLFWSRNGPRLTFYRNRSRSNLCQTNEPGSFTVDDTDGSQEPWAADFTNVIGNSANTYTSRPSIMASCPDTEDDTTLSDQMNHLWVEDNAYRSTDLGGDGPFNVGTANGISCGDRTCSMTSSTYCDEDSDCPGEETCDAASCPATNKNVSSPDASWTGDYPTSLYRTSVPSWWCQEACAWDQTGIGAFGDDFGGTLCKLPAQIRYEAETCTAIARGPGGSLGGGIGMAASCRATPTAPEEACR